jgi:hypothetical protein
MNVLFQRKKTDHISDHRERSYEFINTKKEKGLLRPRLR